MDNKSGIIRNGLRYGLVFLLGIVVSAVVFDRLIERKLTHLQERGITAVNLRHAGDRVGGSQPYFQPVADFEKAASKAVSAVVYVSTSNKSFFGLEYFNEDMPTGTGSGVIISEDGYIVTNHHVIEDANQITVTLNDKREYNAKLIASDPNTDLAVLKIDANSLPTLAFGNSDDVHIGQWVMAVGNPFSLTSTVTAGIVSARARNIGILRRQLKSRQDYSIEAFIQTDAAVNPGNSGGALVSLSGELIGINTAIATETGSFAGYSFAIPSNLARKVVADLIAHGVVQRGFIGVTIQDSDARSLRRKSAAIPQGAYVAGLADGGAASAAGIREGDIITHINGKKVNSSSELQEQVAMYAPGDKIKVEVLRDGVTQTFYVTLRNLEGNTMAVKPQTPKKSLPEFGAVLTPVPEIERQALGIQGGAKVAELYEGGILAQMGVPEGFIITKINRQKIRTPSDVHKAFETASRIVYIEGFRPSGRRATYLYDKAE